MAWITVRNAEVTNVFYNDTGAKIKESFTKRDGEPGAMYFSAFFDGPHGLSIGDKGTFGGVLGVKPEMYQDKPQANVTINQATYEAAGGDDF